MSKTETIRTFLAIEIPQALRDKLGRLETAFVDNASAVRWSKPDLLHITVRFLGGVPSDRMDTVKASAVEAAQQVQTFSLTLSGLGAFPTERSPRVLWVGLEHDPGYVDLERLHEVTEDALALRGFPREERAFSPHITLGRTRPDVSTDDRRGLGMSLSQVKATHPVAGRFDVNRLVVMRSDLSRSGPIYTPIAAYPLRGGA